MSTMVYHVSDAIISPLGFDSQTTFTAVAQGATALRAHLFPDGQTAMAAKLDTLQEALLSAMVTQEQYSKFERLCIVATQQALAQTDVDITDKETLIILSTTKGNIEWINHEEKKELLPLHISAQRIAAFFKHPNPVQCVSVACISGVAAQIMAKRLLQVKRYRHAVIIGCDIVSDFVRAGFSSFQALSPEQCIPFDAARKGLNLGEAAACLILSREASLASETAVLGGGSISNDANHLSGPSKTGAELALAITKSMKEAGTNPTDIGFVSAHGTATNYNDEMEAKAISLASLQNTPVNSLKCYFGHTLGASGLLESIISLKAMEENVLLPILHFGHSNTSVPINIISKKEQQTIDHFVKTAAGFGGCNAAVVWSKIPS
ncbi:beta-ketoacyl synthase [Taibaiella sp. KBW10]|uniref:beta-ketoacyl synthase N-terminal-like domain-containing protein n=1 Tax=Taibaiella sp. KBW10 TaxID=2153357 RepID=UPI000F5932B2|nr:beta-ketoacyl synthase N-terminal-like domain-containing protein [Taibaiella sp. KBW10]RQO32476.1 beta-ketoacyl synthase [Taibaiella sp. KBW10]